MIRTDIANKKIELNEHFKRALGLMENGSRHVFVTGRAGTGKSTLLDYFRRTTKRKVVVLAPTGVAAVNVQGQTIHSFFGFKPNITPDRVKRYRGPNSDLYRAVETIIIDEVSMVRADLMDCVDRFMRLNGRDGSRPFGGVQMVFIGDLYQLPPVVTGKEREIFRSHYKSQYFFDSNVFEGLEMEFIELEKVYRQKDKGFLEILNAIRNNTVSDRQLRKINSRLDEGFEPDPDSFYINLTTTNNMSADINVKELSKIKAKTYHYKGKITGEFDIKYLPTEIDLSVKVGSQIMFLNNDRLGRWINGTVGKIIGIEKSADGDIIRAELQNGMKIEVEPFTWKIYRMYYDKETRSLGSESIGSFTQYPIKLAWAVTIHKGQGKTFDNVIIDIGKGTFSHGQVYVALSRCTSLNGIVLRKPIHKKHIFMDWKVVRFLTKYQYMLSERRLSLKDKIGIIRGAIKGKQKLDIVYLKSNDEKSRRSIEPKFVGEMEYMGRPYIGVEAFCHKRQDDRIFRVDKILEIHEPDK